jgi:hypothetical protein
MDQDRFEVIKNLITFLVLAGLVGVFFVCLIFFFSVLI